MILYHYTALELLEAIEKEGLTKGELAITDTQIKNAVWFTSDQDPSGHGLSDGGPISDVEREIIERKRGEKLPDQVIRLDKRRVRIQVGIATTDRNLKQWVSWAKKNLDESWMKNLIEAGGGMAKAKSWYIYDGKIIPAKFGPILVRNIEGQFVPITEDDRVEGRNKSKSI